MGDIQIRHTVESLFALKLKILDEARTLWEADNRIREMYDSIKGYTPYSLRNTSTLYGEKQDEKCIDQALWSYFVKLYNLEKLMLCTDYKKMMKEIEEFRTPAFTIENASGWLAGLESLIRNNVETLIKQVYSEVTNGFYYTGSGYRAPKKKRNNNGIDKTFILVTHDYSRVFSYYTSGPSVMDDLEKVCYLLDGKCVPEITLINEMKGEKKATASNAYMTVKLCKNGNTHFTLEESTREKLNKYGPSGAIIGENIKIKIFE
jgi:hypothetical protein